MQFVFFLQLIILQICRNRLTEALFIFTFTCNLKKGFLSKTKNKNKNEMNYLDEDFKPTCLLDSI
jgi:hypothetical protein